MRTLAAVVLVLAGCTQPVDSYCEAYARAECTKEQRCGRVSKHLDCTQLRANSDCLADMQPELEAKRVSYDAAAAYRCVKAIENESCDVFLGESDDARRACGSIAVGSHERGDYCGGCKRGLICATSSLACGTCVETLPKLNHAAAGEACNYMKAPELVFCERDSYCNGGYAEGICVPKWKIDEPCAESGTCVENAMCVDSVCAPLGETGAVCESTSACLRGLWCSAGKCQLQKTVGESCVASEECLSTMCFEGQCTLSREAGESCDSAGAPCVATANCVDGGCVAKPRAGETCDGVECYDSVCSATSDAGVCLALPNHGCW